MLDECPPAFRSAPAVAGIGSAKRRSVRPPIAIAPRSYSNVAAQQECPLSRGRWQFKRKILTDEMLISPQREKFRKDFTETDGIGNISGRL